MDRRIRLGALMLLVAIMALAFGIYRNLVIGRPLLSVQGDVMFPRQLPVIEGMTVVDALQAAGNLTLPISSIRVRLIRPSTRNIGSMQTLPIDLDAIMNKGDSAANLPILAGDRVVVFRDRTDITDSTSP